MVEKKINNGKIKLNQRLMAFILAGACTFTLAGCKNFPRKGPQASIGVVKNQSKGYSYIEGAYVEIFDDDNKLVQSWISDDNCHDVYGLEDGHYTIKISYEPDNYYLVGDLIIENGKQKNKPTFILDADKYDDTTNEYNNLPKIKKYKI